MNAPCRDCPERCIGCRRSCRRWKAYQLTLKIIKVRAKKHCYLDPMPDSRTNEVKTARKNTKASASEVNVMLTLPIKRKWFDMICLGENARNTVSLRTTGKKGFSALAAGHPKMKYRTRFI